MPRSDSLPAADYIPEFEEKTAAAIGKLPRKCTAIKIPIPVLADRGLTLAEKTLFGIVLATDVSDDGSFWSNDTIEALTGLCQGSITKAYAKLADRGLVEIEYKLENGRTKRIVKSLFNWAMVRGGEGNKIYYPNKIHYGNKNPLANIISSKEDIIKDLKPSRLRAEERRASKTPSPKKRYATDSLEFQLATLQVELIRKWNPEFPRPNIDKWAADFDWLLNIRKFSYPRIEAVLRFWQGDEFWRDKGAGDPGYLRRPKKFDELEFKAISEGRRKPRPGDRKPHVDRKPGEGFGKARVHTVEV